ncbi:MAG: hypothetical protein K8R25_11730 [Methanosarcinales archaeon]|nr:hypothetical protein [Methanosarcinales archaeon]
MVDQSEKITLAEERGIKFRRDEYNDILIKRVSLDEIRDFLLFSDNGQY